MHLKNTPESQCSVRTPRVPTCGMTSAETASDPWVVLAEGRREDACGDRATALVAVLLS